MCNCGGKTAPRSSRGSIAGAPVSLVKRATAGGHVEFEYTGQTAMTVRGPFSGLRYRFPHPGARLRIDARDANSFAAVPGLRMV